MQEHEKTGGNAPIPDVLKEIASACDGKINEVGILPDGSGFATMSMPLCPDHWIYGKEFNGEYEAPPMVFRMGAESRAVVDVFDHSGAKQKPSVVVLVARQLEEILAHTPAGAASIRPDGSIVVGMTRSHLLASESCVHSVDVVEPVVTAHQRKKVLMTTISKRVSRCP